MNDNKLISEFMGVAFHDDENQYYNADGLHIGNTLQYHTSWDWLLPVVDKIKILVMEDDSDKLYNSEEWDNITHTLVQIEIKFVYKAVVEFIKTYNKTS